MSSSVEYPGICYANHHHFGSEKTWEKMKEYLNSKDERCLSIFSCLFYCIQSSLVKQKQYKKVVRFVTGHTRWVYSLGSFNEENVPCKRKQTTKSLNLNLSIKKGMRPYDLWQRDWQYHKISCQEDYELSENPRGINRSISIWKGNKPLWLTCKWDRLLNWRRRAITDFEVVLND